MPGKHEGETVPTRYRGEFQRGKLMGPDRRTWDPEMHKVMMDAGRGINPLGWFDHSTSPYAKRLHNPYLHILIAIVVLAVAVFTTTKMWAVPVAAIAASSPFWLFGVGWIAWNARRIPAWHRARGAVSAYIAGTDIQFPAPLRWWA